MAPVKTVEMDKDHKVLSPFSTRALRPSRGQ